MLPILLQREDICIVELNGQPVMNSRDLAKALSYGDERAVHKIYNRNKSLFREGDVNLLPSDDTAEIILKTAGGTQKVRVFTKRGVTKICMKSKQPSAIQAYEFIFDLFEELARRERINHLHLNHQNNMIKQTNTALITISNVLEQLGCTLDQTSKQIRNLVSNSKERTVPETSALLIERKRRSHHKVEQLGVADLVLDLYDEGKTYQEIVARIFEETHQRITDSSVLRFIQTHHPERLS